MYSPPSPLGASRLSFSSPFPKLQEIPLLNSLIPSSCTHFSHARSPKLTGSRSRKWDTNSQKGEDPSVTVASPTIAKSNDDNVLYSASEVVRNFYGGINNRDLDSVEDLIAENCVYEDLIFPSPFVGRKEILEFFKKFINSTTRDLQFTIDDLSTEDASSVGVIWHLEWKGKPFPFSKGCSFYRLQVINGKRQITYGRDSVEPAFKPGDTALALIRSVTWLLQQFPHLADRF